MHFPNDYFQSRRTFLELADRHGAVITSYRHESASRLYTDVALFGAPDALDILVVVSGTHGVEGYAGAACQHWTMQNIQKDLFRDGTYSLLLVHALNPWGFAHDRRVTEEGVDLNRNFVDRARIEHCNTAYGSYHELLIPNQWHSARKVLNDLKLLYLLLGKNRDTVRQAITGGQYDYPAGLFYGGGAPTSANIVWQKIAARYLLGKKAKGLIDIHTGLGAFGEAYLLTDRKSDDIIFGEMREVFGTQLTSTDNGKSVSSKNTGTLTNEFDTQEGGSSYAMVMEFGTRHPLRVLNALRRDHWMASQADEHQPKEQEKTKAMMRQAFVPTSATWQQAVIRQYSDTFRKFGALIRSNDGPEGQHALS